MPVPVSQIALDPERKELIAVDVNGLLWHGTLSFVGETREDDSAAPVINWRPIKGPPDGQHFTEAQKSFWDRMERKARELAQASPNPSGTPLSLATEDAVVTSSAGESARRSPDDSVEDGEGDDPRD